MCECSMAVIWLIENQCRSSTVSTLHFNSLLIELNKDEAFYNVCIVKVLSGGLKFAGIHFLTGSNESSAEAAILEHMNY